ncbi:MAG: Crp/Fnr family transcriptional regulator [Acutalibacter sp.]
MSHYEGLPLFEGMDDTQCQHLLECFQTTPRTFHAGETAYTYGGGMGHILGILQEGEAALVKIDASGSRTVLERLGKGGVFGELLAFSSLPCDSVSVVCESECVMVFLPQARLTAPCTESCSCHRRLLENLLGLISKKAFDLSERVEVLSCRTTREKLLCFFRICAGQERSLNFTLPFSLSALADYICADRSAMMRELKKLKEEGVVETSGRQVRFLSDKPFGQADLCAASWK